MTGAHSTGERFKATMALLILTRNISHFGISYTISVYFVSATSPTILSLFLETLQVFCIWYEDVHVVWTSLSHFLFSFF